MSDKLFLNAIKLKGEVFPTWTDVPENIWKTILKDYFFKVSDSFGFENILEVKNLFPLGLNFFNDWNLKEIGLVEFENEIVCRFELNNDCRNKLLQFDFAVHEKGMNPPINYWEFDSEHYYYEFDILYFFKGAEVTGYYINHENMIGFINHPDDLNLLNSLDENVTRYIIESEDLAKALKRNEF